MARLKKQVLGPWHKRSLYLVCGLLWLSGVFWLYFRYCVHTSNEFGLQTHPAQAVILKIHGALAMGFLIVFGSVLYHIKPGWRQKSQRPSGTSLLIVCGILILTGWGLYYVGGDELRNWSSLSHSILGFLLPLIIFLHVWSVRNRKGFTSGLGGSRITSIED